MLEQWRIGSGDAVHPTVLALDVNETLSDLRPLAARLEQVGAARDLLELWFTSVLRDGFALAAAGAYADFADVALDALRSALAQVDGLAGAPDKAAAFVLDGMGELPLHPQTCARGLSGCMPMASGLSR